VLNQEEQFRIEAKTRDGLKLEGTPRRFPPEEFEAALRVLNLQAGEKADEQVENPARCFSSPWLMDANQSSVERAGSHRGIGALTLNRRK
jgi:hypothetical protein